MHDTNVAVLGVAPDHQATTTGRFRINTTELHAACARKGATTDRERALLMGVTVKTLYRWKRGEAPPRLDVIDRVCRNVELTRHVLFPEL